MAFVYSAALRECWQAPPNNGSRRTVVDLVASPHARWKRGNRLPPEVWIESLRKGRDVSRPRRFVTENTANTPTRRLPPGGVD